MKKHLFFFIALTTLFINADIKAQNIGQVIRGTVFDAVSQSPIPGAQVIVLGTEPLKMAVSDVDGKFKITGVAAGRYDLKVSYFGYKEKVVPSLVVTAGKEVVLDLGVEENINGLEEVVVSTTKKNETNNELVSVSGRSFSMEEVNRYAGGRSDPARLAANFAGVSSPDDSRNDLVIRGNSPVGVLWRIEGLNIPNPNHFSTIGTTGGPVSAINPNVLRNSDFFTSAFPAEYGNANAGVFDLGFRNGNSETYEHTIQLGALTGLEAMTEGPINKAKGSSYLIAYRYSFTGLAQEIGLPIGTTATPFYQDISFKINSGNSKLGKFTLFGLAGKSNIEFLHDEIDTTDLFADPSKDSYFSSDMALIGLKHFIKVGQKSYFNTVVGTTYAASNYLEDTVAYADGKTTTTLENTTKRIHYVLNTSFNTKVNAKLFTKFGLITEVMSLNLFYRDRTYTPDWIQIWDTDDLTTLLQGYAHAKYSFNEKLTLNLGLHSQYLTLNGSTSIEPRMGLKYQLTRRHAFSAGYGMHSQTQPTDVYFYRTQNPDGSTTQTNTDLGFTNSQHFVLGYDYSPLGDWRLKSEVYYQMLSNVPVTQYPSSFSMLNAGASFAPVEVSYLVNEGSGTNYGVELTIEKFFSKGYYGMVTGSLYDSKFEASNNVEYNTAFNGKYVYNVLAGKEFKLGKNKRNALSFDMKFTQAGGRYYTPVDQQASQAANNEVLMGDEYAYSQRHPDFLRLDLKMSYTMNSASRKLSQTISFDVQNVTNNKNVFAQRYNPVTGTVNTAYQIGIFPNFIYKVQF
ncbi:MAG: TonB-dependent receptor [Bacteroidia bacterium]|nr:TonB-dependent receptor [Bacteroidia bacterium]